MTTARNGTGDREVYRKRSPKPQQGELVLGRAADQASTTPHLVCLSPLLIFLPNSSSLVLLSLNVYSNTKNTNTETRVEDERCKGKIF